MNCVCKSVYFEFVSSSIAVIFKLMYPFLLLYAIRNNYWFSSIKYKENQIFGSGKFGLYLLLPTEMPLQQLNKLLQASAYPIHLVYKSLSDVDAALLQHIRPTRQVLIGIYKKKQ